MTRRLGLALALMVVALAGCAGHLVYPTGPFRGRVVDAVTGEPIAGAAVLFVWYREGPGLGHSWEAYHDAAEVVTDADGRFALPERTHFVFFGGMALPHVTIFFPGYRHGFGDPKALTSGVSADVVRLGKAEPNERRRWASMPGLSIGVPHSKMPQLIRLVDEERARLGIHP